MKDIMTAARVRELTPEHAQRVLAAFVQYVEKVNRVEPPMDLPTQGILETLDEIESKIK